MNEDKKLFLIDASAYFYRAYFAIPYLSTSDGFPTNAIYGFTTMLQKLIREYRPAYVAAILDCPEPTFRHEVYHEYKGFETPEFYALPMPDRESEVVSFRSVCPVRVFYPRTLLFCRWARH